MRFLFISLLLLGTTLYADERALGERLITEKACITCHDKNGKGSAPINPNLGGQWKIYMINTMIEMQTQERKSLVMYPLIKDLTLEEIRAIATYYSVQNP